MRLREHKKRELLILVLTEPVVHAADQLEGVLSELSVGAESHHSSFAEKIHSWPVHIAYLSPFPRENFELRLAIELSIAETAIRGSTNVQAHRSMISSFRTTSC